MTCVVCCTVPNCKILAVPKSVTFTVSSAVSIRLAGLMSRWITLRSCANCSALQFAHERNVIHRDIKPANLMLTADATVKVTDFGTAKILQFGTVQQTTHVMGTPSYMSPEQVKGRPVDGRSDIFSLGVVLYEMLTAEKPFPGQSITTVIYKIVNEDPIPPRQLNPSIHPGLNEIVLRALSKEPETRYQNCREMLEDLRNYRALGANDGNPDATLISPI